MRSLKADFRAIDSEQDIGDSQLVTRIRHRVLTSDVSHNASVVECRCVRFNSARTVDARLASGSVRSPLSYAWGLVRVLVVSVAVLVEGLLTML